MESAHDLNGETITPTMSAFARDRYGMPEVLDFRIMPTPTVADNQVLLRVHASSVNPYDLHMLTGTPYVARLQGGIRSPKNSQLGSDVAGTIVAMGADVTGFEIDDEVFGACPAAYAEYALARFDRVVHKPANASFAEAASTPLAATTALQGLRDKGHIAPGHHVLINGASGGIGTQAVQIAKSMGATVTGVCSTRNVDMVRGLGADHVIDYTEVDYARNGQKYDIILDTVGNRSMRDNRRALVADGRYVMIGVPKKGNWIGPLLYPLKALALSLFSSQTMGPMLATYTDGDLAILRELLESSELKPVIDQRFPLSDTPDALRRQAAGHAQGKTVIIAIEETK